MIIPEIVEIFPDAKFVFLFRNPIHVYASILTTWGDGSFKRLFKHKIDIDKGPQLLSHGYESIKDRAYALRYEELVSDPIPHLKKLMSYLDLEYEETMLTKFTDVTFEGRAGDTTGVHAYKEIDIEGLEKWKRVFSTRFRKKILRKYVMKLPDDALATQGYHKSQLIDDIDKIKVMRLTPTKDYYYYFISELVTYLRADLFGLDKSKSFLSRLFHDYGGLYG